MSDTPQKAAALKYKHLTDRVPRVTAKGEGQMAEKIIKAAREHGIYIHRDPDLVEVLSKLDIDQEIPRSLYIVVAEILAFVYLLNEEKKSGHAGC